MKSVVKALASLVVFIVILSVISHASHESTMEVTSDKNGATATVSGPFGGKTTCKSVINGSNYTMVCN